MKRNCPKISCHSPQIIKSGHYFRKNDSRKIQRFKCKICGTQFSTSTGTLEYRQKKRRVNYMLMKLFASKVSQRRAAKIVGVNKVTAARKFDYWSKKAALENAKFREKLRNHQATHIQFDDQITKEKTKLKPLSITVMSDVERRFILGFKVSQIPSFGHLAKISVKKYGYRKSYHHEALNELFTEVTPLVHQRSRIDSDEHKTYEQFVRKFFPKANYKQYKGQKSSIAGQGELKKTGYDPLNSINHTLAMLRDGVSTLVRKSWAVTQDPNRLRGHLEIFTFYYNQIYLGGLPSP